MRSLTLKPMHPGEVLREEFMVPLGLTAYRVARAIDVPPNRIQDIARERRNITPGTALRLAKLFGTSAEFWMNLQTHYDLECERESSEAAIDAIKQIILEA
ncbi:MAG TPA: addiction module antidote protein, HigA family [Halieaceae bacterium]|nr:addiction module antidote protein, HigA family [Halieaceae bacterium]|tara:strand:- start:39 stop:341 length:303 start_codon:yes stop_codon:yes gene_type:complete